MPQCLVDRFRSSSVCTTLMSRNLISRGPRARMPTTVRVNLCSELPGRERVLPSVCPRVARNLGGIARGSDGVVERLGSDGARARRHTHTPPQTRTERKACTAVTAGQERRNLIEHGTHVLHACVHTHLTHTYTHIHTYTQSHPPTHTHAHSTHTRAREARRVQYAHAADVTILEDAHTKP